MTERLVAVGANLVLPGTGFDHWPSAGLSFISTFSEAQVGGATAMGCGLGSTANFERSEGSRSERPKNCAALIHRPLNTLERPSLDASNS